MSRDGVEHVAPTGLIRVVGRGSIDLPRRRRFQPGATLNGHPPRGRRLQRHPLSPKKKDRQRTTAKRIKLPLLHSCPGGICKSSIHSP